MHTGEQAVSSARNSWVHAVLMLSRTRPRRAQAECCGPDRSISPPPLRLIKGRQGLFGAPVIHQRITALIGLEGWSEQPLTEPLPPEWCAPNHFPSCLSACIWPRGVERRSGVRSKQASVVGFEARPLVVCVCVAVVTWGCVLWTISHLLSRYGSFHISITIYIYIYVQFSKNVFFLSNITTYFLIILSAKYKYKALLLIKGTTSLFSFYFEVTLSRTVTHEKMRKKCIISSNI